MKRKKDVIKKAVLASVLAMSLNNVVWAAEGVNQPFSTVRNSVYRLQQH